MTKLYGYDRNDDGIMLNKRTTISMFRDVKDNFK